MSRPPKKPDKKKMYEKPRLTAYGDVREITKAVGMWAAPDGGFPGMNRVKT
ncbi:MAG: lasso RiPP family leader peptide-containing protein [Gemmatimonadota bacterium]|nr:lasso RiPP family leader peptide-containing protein [Gemmatimonadota bacterium]